MVQYLRRGSLLPDYKAGERLEVYSKLGQMFFAFFVGDGRKEQQAE